ncbi:hypothetical protein GCM10022406_36630 [Hymenobacter algoricola]|uniref:Glycosyltransferase RgtA/B/C/D-like domain-containing protein n=2 Tax=Hymenobacter algoricola TaxID=486267 RepID=A0ABP7NPL2_9BACT
MAAPPRPTHRLAPYVLPTLLLGGLALRLLFMAVGAAFYYKANSPFSNNDTYSFTQSFMNLWQHGHYSFNPLNPEAAFGRLPGFPFFWGGHYLLFGEKYVFQAVAFTQCLLDTVAIYLVYATARALTQDVRAGWVSGLLYAGYPFVIVWLTMSGSEALATFLTIVVFWWLATRPATGRNALIAGLLVAVALMVREYLGVLLLPVAFWVFSAKGISLPFVRLGTLAALGFLVVYISWPIRNYVFQHRLVLLKTATAGYDRYAEDVNSARQWVYGWSSDSDPYLDGIAGKAPLPEFPAEVFATPAEAARAQQLIRQARQCGTGFHSWRYNQRYEQPTNCNAELAAGFEALNASYKQRYPLSYWTRVPFANLKRAVFKSQLKQDAGGGSKVVTILFGYRSLLILLSLAGAWLLRRRRPTWPVVFFFTFMYLFLCFGIRHLEMRYLLQADAALLCLAGAPLMWLFDRLAAQFRTVSAN